MKRKSMILSLLALVFGAGMMLSSCKDNENASDVNPDEEVLEKGSEKGEALLSILSMAAELDSLPDDWYKNTYTVEPTIGTVKDEANPYVRYVAVSDSADAYTVYKSMVSEDLTGTVKDETWIKDGIGSLAFKVVKNQADLIATVDVNVQQMPHLKQICFVPASALPDNSGWFSGDPYYQFGDVVKDTGDDTYWFCARPANKAAGKSTTHWVSFNIPDTNFKEYEKAGYAKLTLPDALGNKAKSEEHILNFMKFLYAAAKGSETDLTLSGVDLSKEDAKLIYNLWRSNHIIEGENKYLTPVAFNYMSNLFNKQNVNVFYYGHCSGKTPDVHMLTTKAPEFKLDKKEIKFEWPKAIEDANAYNFKNYLNPEGNTADLASLTCKKDNHKMPEKAIIMRYKTGPQLSGQSSLLGNDKYPGQSYTTYTNGKIEDIFVSSPKISEMSNTERYYCVGDKVKIVADEKELICVKSASSFHFGSDAINKRAIFIGPHNDNLENYQITKEEIKMVMFNMLNALLRGEGAIDFTTIEYDFCLFDLNTFLILKNIKEKGFTQEGNNYNLNIYWGHARYRLEYIPEKNKYNFYEYVGDYDGNCPQVTICACDDNGNEQNHQYTIETKSVVGNRRVAADEAAILFQKAVIEEIDTHNE